MMVEKIKRNNRPPNRPPNPQRGLKEPIEPAFSICIKVPFRDLGAIFDFISDGVYQGKLNDFWHKAKIGQRSTKMSYI